MTMLSDHSIRHRLTRFMALVTGSSLLCMALGFLSYEYVALRATILRNANAQAEVVANSSDAALEFGSAGDAERILASIAVDKQITAACIFDQAGQPFAAYPPRAFPEGAQAGPLRGSRHAFGSGVLDVSRAIVSRGRPLGSVFIRTDLGEIRSRLVLTTLVLAGLGLVIFAGTFLVSAKLRQQISDPILALSEAARKVSQDRDYGIRLNPGQGGEIGVLAESLNDMLAQIQTRDAMLVDYKDHLEDQVAQRSEQLLRVNTQLLLAKERAEDASHAKSAFLANMSHELRTPLNAILLYSEILIEEVTERGAEVLAVDINKIQLAGRHLLSLIDDILDLSKIEAGRMTLYLEEIALPELLEDIATTLEPLVSRNHNRLLVEAAPDLPALFTDHKKLKQTLFNLLGNAAKFTKNGTVSLNVQTGPERSMVFTVVDTGIGMSAAQVQRIFLEFTQGDDSTTRKFGGTGLGLTLSRKFAEMLGGTLEVHSVEGAGSTFTLTLPCGTAELSGPTATPVKPQALGQRGKVLIIDDDPAMREAVSRQLTKEGFWTAVAATGAEGLQMARALRPNVITLDIAMPGMDGWEVLNAIKTDSELQDTPVVLITMMDGRAKGYALGAAAFLQKPVPRDLLLKTVARHTSPPDALPILLVEDDAVTRKALERLLSNEGWQVHCAQDGGEALERLERERACVILLDLMMPGMDGFQVIATLQDHPLWHSIPIIVLTAKELTKRDRELLATPQVQRVLAKGAYSMQDLMDAIRQMTIRCVEEPHLYSARD